MAEAPNPSPNRSPENRRKRSGLRLLAGTLILIFVAIITTWWLFSRSKISTDDAYVMADSVIVSSRVTGTVLRCPAKNDVYVSTDDVLLELDPNDYRALADRARAALDRTEAEIRMARITVQLTEDQTLAQVQAAQAAALASQGREREARHRIAEIEQIRTGSQAELSHARRDLERYANLYQEGAGSEQQRDRTSTVYKKAKAQTEATDAQVAKAKDSLAVALQEVDHAKAQLQNANAERLRVDIERNRLASLQARRAEQQAELTTAELNLSYCTVKAPISGYVAQSRVEAGQRVQAGQPLLALVPLQEVYVEANYKETQLEGVRLGQPAVIKADIYPGYTYFGKVVGIRAGTGAAFSLLPPENATGNWIKVVQRIPVKIRLDSPPPPEFPLRVGASLEVTISTSDRSGLRLPVQGNGKP